jgi:CPA2 family monovalent cation:H+ antiporter-2
MLLPFDNVGIIATDDQMQEFTKMFDATKEDEAADHNLSDIILQKITVNEHTRLKVKTIRNSNIREQTNGLVVGIERNKLRILNPDSTTVFEWGDIVWIVGERKKIQKLGGG